MKSFTQEQAIEAIKNLASEAPIEVLWLYGSRATGSADDYSDYDLAIALKQASNRRQIIDDLSYDWNSELGLNISIIDINAAPIPLSYNVINLGKPVYVNNDLRLHTEEQRIWSLWSEYEREHQKYYP
jgi:predicted nucleotidyltransferase